MKTIYLIESVTKYHVKCADMTNQGYEDFGKEFLKSKGIKLKKGVAFCVERVEIYTQLNINLK